MKEVIVYNEFSPPTIPNRNSSPRHRRRPENQQIGVVGEGGALLPKQNLNRATLALSSTNTTTPRSSSPTKKKNNCHTFGSIWRHNTNGMLKIPTRCFFLQTIHGTIALTK